MIGSRTAAMNVVRESPVFGSRSGRIATRGPHMNRFRLAAAATLTGVLLASGCASPCGGCGNFHRMSMFRARSACPCECCSSCGGGPTIAGSSPMMMGEGPLLEPPGPPMGTMPPPSGMMDMPGPFPPSMGAPAVPSMPGDPGRINPTPLPNAAQPFPSLPSSRVRR